MAERRITTDEGTDLRVHVEVVDQNAEENTTTLRVSLSGRVVIARLTPTESETQ